MFSTIQDIQYVTWTVFGDSDKKIGGKEDFSSKPQGLGQGNSAGASMWSVESSKMFEVLHSWNCTTKICGFAFVDGSDIIALSGYSNNPIKTLEKCKLQLTAGKELQSPQGVLEPNKSWWYLIHFTWNN